MKRLFAAGLALLLMGQAPPRPPAQGAVMTGEQLIESPRVAGPGARDEIEGRFQRGLLLVVHT